MKKALWDTAELMVWDDLPWCKLFLLCSCFQLFLQSIWALPYNATIPGRDCLPFLMSYVMISHFVCRATAGNPGRKAKLLKFICESELGVGLKIETSGRYLRLAKELHPDVNKVRCSLCVMFTLHRAVSSLLLRHAHSCAAGRRWCISESARSLRGEMLQHCNTLCKVPVPEELCIAQAISYSVVLSLHQGKVVRNTLQEICFVWQVLSDDARRREYDRQSQWWATPFWFFDFLGWGLKERDAKDN